MFKKHSEVQSDLQALADQVGASRFEAAKAAYLKGVVVTDENGSPLKPDDIKFEVTVKAAEAPESPDISAMVKAEVEKATKTVNQARTERKADVSQAIVAKSIEVPLSFRPRFFKSSETAFKMGQWIAAIAGSESAKQFCIDKGITVQKTGLESNNTLGGFLVPDEFATTVIDLKEKYGVFRQFAELEPMASDVKHCPRRESGLTAYFPAEADSITTSDMGWGNVTLTARKMAVRTKTSSELNEDALINLADKLAEEMALAFAYKEDDCGWNGDGTSTYGGIYGLRNKIGAGSTYASADHNLYSELDYDDFAGAIGLLPEYAEVGDPAWYVSKVVWGQMQTIAGTAGGASTQDVVNGVRQKMFMGYPVRVSQALPSTAANSQIYGFFGSLRLASKFGERRGMSIAMATQGDTDFASDLISWRGTQRVDIVNHAVGTASVAGAIIALKLHSA